MMMTIEIGDFRLSVTPIKYNSNIYWITCPHGIFIDSDKEYTMIFNSKPYNLRLYKQAYWCDLAIFVSIEKVPIKKKNLKILKSHPKLLNLNVKNSIYNLKGTLTKFNYNKYLGIRDGNRNLNYEITLNTGRISNGMSGSAFYHIKKQKKTTTEFLIGILSFTIDDPTKGYLVPGFFILKLLNEKKSNYSPFLQLKLKMDKGNVVLSEDCYGIKKNTILVRFNNLIISRACIYVSELKDNLPIDVFLQIYGELDTKLSITDDKDNDYELTIENLNDYIENPFISGVSNDIKGERITYQDIWMERRVIE